jgi:predicted protein tyrosine phosphatase
MWLIPTYYNNLKENLINLLFVCTENRLRSPTAEAVFTEYAGINALSAGTNTDAETSLSGDLIEWADIIFVMEKMHKNKISKKFSSLLKNKRLICLAIADHYDYMQPELVQLLKRKVAQHLDI